jgi:hypothetical protein
MSALKPALSAVSILLALTSCQKKAEPQAQAAPESQVSSPAASQSMPAAETAPPAEVDPEVARRKAAMEFALAEQKIADDPLGQWAVSARASSTFASGTDEKASYQAWQATGAPNVTRYSDSTESWASKEQDKGIEWLEVGFAKAVHATELRIRQSNEPGAIIKVELIDDTGGKHTVFSGVDETSYPPQTIAWFTAKTEKTPYPVKGALITLATNAVSGWNEIDAVQLIGE